MVNPGALVASGAGKDPAEGFIQPREGWGVVGLNFQKIARDRQGQKLKQGLLLGCEPDPVELVQQPGQGQSPFSWGESFSWFAGIAHGHNRFTDQSIPARFQNPVKFLQHRGDVGNVMQDAEAGDEVKRAVRKGQQSVRVRLGKCTREAKKFLRARHSG